MTPRTTAWAAVAAIAVVLAVAAGCSDPPPCCQPVDGHDGAVVVSGAHANSPAPALTPQTRQQLTAVLAAGLPVDLVGVSGAPAVAPTLKLKKVKGTPAGRRKLAEDNLHTLTGHLSDPPAADGSDVLEAFQVAAGQARSRGMQHPLLVVIDSGLPDRGRLDLTRPGILGAQPAEVAKQLTAAHALPDLTGATVLWSGIGYTSAPQQPLDGPLRAGLGSTWTAVLTAAGATVVLDPAPRAGDPVATDTTVTPTPLPVTPPPPPPCRRTTLVFTSQGAVSFRSNSDAFVDPDWAHRALDPIAAFLAADPDRTATVTGTTADDGALAGQRRRGRSRADAVKAYLVDQGARSGQVTTRGVGSDFPLYVRPDRDGDGNLLPGPAALNRSVRITTRDDCP